MSKIVIKFGEKRLQCDYCNNCYSPARGQKYNRQTDQNENTDYITCIHCKSIYFQPENNIDVCAATEYVDGELLFKVKRYNPIEGEVVDEVPLTAEVLLQIDPNKCTHNTTLRALVAGMTCHTNQYDYCLV